MNIQRYINGVPVERKDLGSYELYSPHITSAVRSVNDRMDSEQQTEDSNN